MKNVMDIKGYKALIAFDPDTNLFRGEFEDIKGGADFNAYEVAAWNRVGEISHQVMLTRCREGGVKPMKN